MAETLLALLLVTSSAKGCSLVYRWPPSPSSSTRLIRPKPIDAVGSYQFDNPWRAAQSSDADTTGNPTVSGLGDEDEEYEWKKPEASRDRSVSFSRSNASHHPASGRHSPSNDDGRVEVTLSCDGYNDLLGYSAEFLASLLCPQGRRRRGSGASGWEREGDRTTASDGPGDVAWLSLSPRSARRHSRRVSGGRSRLHASDRSDEQYYMNGDTRSDEDDGDVRGKECSDCETFRPINQYFDGRCTDDEVLFRAEITREQLREVLHHYEEYLQTFLHLS